MIDDLLHKMQKHRADVYKYLLALTFDKREGMRCSIPGVIRWHGKWKARQKNEPGRKARLFRCEKKQTRRLSRAIKGGGALDPALNHGEYRVMERFLDALSKPFCTPARTGRIFRPPEPTETCPYRTFCGT